MHIIDEMKPTPPQPVADTLFTVHLPRLNLTIILLLILGAGVVGFDRYTDGVIDAQQGKAHFNQQKGN